MRENPWHDRRATWEHEHRYRNLVDLHALSIAWLKDLAPSKTSAIGAQLQNALAQLGGLTGAGVEALLDDTTPDELLERLEQTVWQVHGWTYKAILARTTKAESAAVRNQFEQVAWKSGKACAETRWKDLAPESRTDLRRLLLAFRDGPLSGYPRQEPFLIRRAIANEIDVELLRCPHQLDALSEDEHADDLCSLQAHWTRGFLYGINTKATVDYQPGSRKARCTQRWTWLP